jgi:hypothetical protein
MPIEQLIAKLSVTPARNEAAQEFQLDAYAAQKPLSLSGRAQPPSPHPSITPQAIKSPDDRVAPQRYRNYGSKADITRCRRQSP